MNHIFTRVSAKGLTITNVTFNYSIFDDCYFRNCTFDSCNFIGSKFIASNFEGSKFIGCNFEYSVFRHTNIEENILDNNCPSHENLRFKFARNLRSNFQSIGNTEGANKAILVELESTKSYLCKAWHSNESYYRKKYQNWDRGYKFISWLKFRVGELVWGNGESLLKLGITVLMIFLAISLIEALKIENVDQVHGTCSICKGLVRSPQIFFNIDQPTHYSKLYISIIYFIRLLFFSLFMAIVIKRFSKR